MQFSLILAVGAGGATGAILRYLTNQISLHYANQAFYSTLAVNLIGCFLIGLIAESMLRLSAQHSFFAANHALLSAFLITGILGGFTTFSSFALDTLSIAKDSSAFASLYVIISVLGGILLAQLGRFLAQLH